MDLRRGLFNPACKAKHIQDLYNTNQSRCDSNDVFLFNEIDKYSSSMSPIQYKLMESIQNCLIALRDMQKILEYDLKVTSEDECMILIYHIGFTLEDDQITYLNFVRRMKSEENIMEVKKDFLIKIYLDIKINTSVALFSLKQFKK